MQATQPVMQTMSPQMQAAQLAAQQPTATVGQPLPQAAPSQLQPGQQAVPQPVAAVVQQAPGQQIPLQPAPGIQVPIQGQQISMQQAGVVAPTAPLAQAAEPYYPAQPATGSEDDRREARKRTLKGGMIVLRGQMMSSYACKIRNESSGGVMLVLADAHLVPPEFYLVRDADPGNKIPCRVAWREKGRLGAQFIPALSPL
ncbi:MAG TPA: hypothetical protein ENJ55_01045 [Rhizobiales bacterium]|nr:hypothetical protein [Hyphomicrobiales bacterium]